MCLFEDVAWLMSVFCGLVVGLRQSGKPSSTISRPSPAPTFALQPATIAPGAPPAVTGGNSTSSGSDGAGSGSVQVGDMREEPGGSVSIVHIS